MAYKTGTDRLADGLLGYVWGGLKWGVIGGAVGATALGIAVVAAPSLIITLGVAGVGGAMAFGAIFGMAAGFQALIRIRRLSGFSLSVLMTFCSWSTPCPS